jgi:Nucleotidyltransferase domain
LDRLSAAGHEEEGCTVGTQLCEGAVMADMAGQNNEMHETLRTDLSHNRKKTLARLDSIFSDADTDVFDRVTELYIANKIFERINQADVDAILARQKHAIIKDTLEHMMHGMYDATANLLAQLSKLGADWPELDVISKSIQANSRNNMVRESRNDPSTCQQLMDYLRQDLVRGDYDNIWEIIGELSWMDAATDEFKPMFDKHKPGVLRSLLTMIRDNTTSDVAYMMPQLLMGLKKLSVTWPELDVIERSLRANKDIDESDHEDEEDMEALEMMLRHGYGGAVLTELGFNMPIRGREEQIRALLQAHKPLIVRTLLEMLRDMSDSDDADDLDYNFEHIFPVLHGLGLGWPELGVIERSWENDRMARSNREYDANDDMEWLDEAIKGQGWLIRSVADTLKRELDSHSDINIGYTLQRLGMCDSTEVGDGLAPLAGDFADMFQRFVDRNSIGTGFETLNRLLMYTDRTYPQLTQVIDANKTEIMRYLLRLVRDNPYNGAKDQIHLLRYLGADWPEFKVITRSQSASKGAGRADDVDETQVAEKRDACYYKVKRRYKVWPSAYASGALVQCRKKGAKNWGRKGTNESDDGQFDPEFLDNILSSVKISFVEHDPYDAVQLLLNNRMTIDADPRIRAAFISHLPLLAKETAERMANDYTDWVPEMVEIGIGLAQLRPHLQKHIDANRSTIKWMFSDLLKDDGPYDAMLYLKKFEDYGIHVSISMDVDQLKGEILKSMLEKIKRYPTLLLHLGSVLDYLRSNGHDWPELKAIEKSMAAVTAKKHNLDEDDGHGAEDTEQDDELLQMLEQDLKARAYDFIWDTLGEIAWETQPTSQHLAPLLNQHKTGILKHLLQEMANCSIEELMDMVPQVLIGLRKLGVDWPELAVIERSLRAEGRIDETWSNKFKRSINCSHPRGFSQRAHCAARRKRAHGGKTKSKPVRENHVDLAQQVTISEDLESRVSESVVAEVLEDLRQNRALTAVDTLYDHRMTIDMDPRLQQAFVAARRMIGNEVIRMFRDSPEVWLLQQERDKLHEIGITMPDPVIADTMEARPRPLYNALDELADDDLLEAMLLALELERWGVDLGWGPDEHEINSRKTQIIRKMLISMRSGHNNMVQHQISHLRDRGIEWPELQAMERSIQASLMAKKPVSEHMSKGPSRPGQQVVDAVRLALPVAQEIWFHGSRAIGQHHKHSDTDILVVIPKNVVGEDYVSAVKILQQVGKNFQNYDIQPCHPGERIHGMAKEEGKLLWSCTNENFADGKAKKRSLAEADADLNTASEAEQIAAVQDDVEAFRHIRNPSEAVQLAAARTDGRFALNHIFDKGLKPSKAVQRAALEQDIHAIEPLIDNGMSPGPKVQAAALQKSPYLIRAIRNPSPDQQLYAVQHDANLIAHIKGPTPEAQLAAVEHNWQLIKNIKRPAAAAQIAAVRQNPAALAYIKPVSPELWADLEFKTKILKHMLQSIRDDRIKGVVYWDKVLRMLKCPWPELAVIERSLRASGEIDEAVSNNYKRSINSSNLRGFSQEREKFVSENVADGKGKTVSWTSPNFDFEWAEIDFQSNAKGVPTAVRQYLRTHFPDKATWLKAAQAGKVVTMAPDHPFDIGNYPRDEQSLTKALSPKNDSGGPGKAARAKEAFLRGSVEMPIVLNIDGSLWLVGGKTRLGTAHHVLKIPAKVWMIGDNLSENFADGKGPGRPGDSQRHGIPKGATMAQLQKAAKAPGRKGQLARWQINMRRGRKRAAHEATGATDFISDLRAGLRQHDPGLALGDVVYAVLRDQTPATPELLDAIEQNKHNILKYLLTKMKTLTLANADYLVSPVLTAFAVLNIPWPELRVIRDSIDADRQHVGDVDDEDYDIMEAVPAHGDEANQAEMMKAGLKPAALMIKPVFDRLFRPHVRSQHWQVLTFTLPHGAEMYVVGLPGAGERMRKIAQLVIAANRRQEDPGEFYHRELGQLLGYSDSDIDDFIQRRYGEAKIA